MPKVSKSDMQQVLPYLDFFLKNNIAINNQNTPKVMTLIHIG